MKLTYFQLEQHLAKNLAPVFIISGDDLILKQEAISLIRKAATHAGFNERTRLTPEAGFDWGELHHLLQSTSLFSEKRLLELDFRDITPPKAASTILQDYAKRTSPDNVILIDTSKVDDKIAKSAWYTALEKMGIAVTIWPIPREQLPQWIINRGKKYKLQINSAAASLLTDYVEGNLIAATQAIEKLYLLKPTEVIDVDFIQAVLNDESHFSIFDFIENLIAGNKTRSLHILENLKLDGTEPVLVLWAITRELRILAELAQQLKQGQSYETLFQKHRIFAKRQPAVRRFLSKTTATDCWQHLTHAAHADKIIKGAAPGNIWETLQLFCLRLV